mmetsp:Transcript_16536/g.52011  ORF Transcript_16536/g.52011 Transcript_16536/m.52011 type:complete len:223 (-) Transcript_16536:622-1290(-)
MLRLRSDRPSPTSRRFAHVVRRKRPFRHVVPPAWCGWRATRGSWTRRTSTATYRRQCAMRQQWQIAFRTLMASAARTAAAASATATPMPAAMTTWQALTETAPWPWLGHHTGQAAALQRQGRRSRRATCQMRSQGTRQRAPRPLQPLARRPGLRQPPALALPQPEAGSAHARPQPPDASTRSATAGVHLPPLRPDCGCPTSARVRASAVLTARSAAPPQHAS